MKNTRFMEVLFSAVENNDEELTAQVAQDIESARENGVVDTDEVKYENAGDGKINITDKETGEVTVAEKAADDAETYDLYPAQITEQVEGFIHPEADGVTPGDQVGADDEDVVEDHLSGMPISECVEEDNVECLAQEGPCEEGECEEEVAEEAEEEVREFSVTTDNTVVLRIFSDQEFCERLFSEVIESEETVKVGDLKIEKDSEDENTVIVTSESTGDQAKVVLEDDEMEVTELDAKNFSEEEQFDPLHVVGVDTFNHQIVDASEFDEESAQELVERLSEQGVDAVQVFDNPEDARDYAIQLLAGLGVESEENVEEPVQAEFSDHTIYVTKFYTNNTEFMTRMFSEAVNDIDASQASIEDAIENGDEIETDTEIITPIDAKTAVIEDKENGEFTKAVMDDEVLDVTPISEEEAEELTDHIAIDEDSAVDEDSEEAEEKEYSNVYCDEAETRFFSEGEEMTEYMIRLFSEDADSAEIENAIENGEQIENDTEIITPIDAKTAVIEDKENGEFTKAVMDDEVLDVTPISEEEAEELTDHIAIDEDSAVDEDSEEAEEKEEEKEFSMLDKFFAEALAPVAPAGQMMFNVDAQGNPISPVAEEAPVAEPTPEVVPGAPSVESIEDKAAAAVQSIQAAAAEAEAAILNAKSAPVENAEEDLKEAQFSEEDNTNDIAGEGTLLTWLGDIKR